MYNCIIENSVTLSKQSILLWGTQRMHENGFSSNIGGLHHKQREAISTNEPQGKIYSHDAKSSSNGLGWKLLRLRHGHDGICRVWVRNEEWLCTIPVQRWHWHRMIPVLHEIHNSSMIHKNLHYGTLIWSLSTVCMVQPGVLYMMAPTRNCSATPAT